MENGNRHSILVSETPLGDVQLFGYRRERELLTGQEVDEEKGYFSAESYYRLGQKTNMEGMQTTVVGGMAFLSEVGILGRIAWDLSHGKLSKKRIIAYGLGLGLAEFVRRQSFKYANSCDEWFMQLVRQHPEATVPPRPVPKTTAPWDLKDRCISVRSADAPHSLVVAKSARQQNFLETL